MQQIRVLPKLVGRDNMGIYDNRCPGNKTVVPTEVIDISSLCPKIKEGQAVLKYAEVTRGRLVQLNDWYKKGEDLGMTTHFHFDELGINGLASDPVFASFARNWGIKPTELARTVFENAPPPKSKKYIN